MGVEGPAPPAARRRRRHGARRPSSTHTSASPSIGSTAPVSVVPAVATTATGTRGRRRGRRGSLPRPPPAGKRRVAVDRERADVSAPSPRISDRRLVDSGPRSERSRAAGCPPRPPAPRSPGSRARARPRAPSCFETVPPLVNAPAAGRKVEELRHPAHRLVIDLGRRRRPDREVGVEAGGEQVAEHSIGRPSGRRRRSSAAWPGRSTRRGPRRASSSTSSAPSGLRAARSRAARERRSSIGGSVSRARSKLRHAWVTMSAARSSASSRGMSRLRVTRGE